VERKTGKSFLRETFEAVYNVKPFGLQLSTFLVSFKNKYGTTFLSKLIIKLSAMRQSASATTVC